MSGDDFETLSSREWGDVPRLFHRWGTPTLGALVFLPVTIFLLPAVFVADSYLFFCAVKRRPKHKSRYTGRVEKAIEYAPTIKNWEIWSRRSRTGRSGRPANSSFLQSRA